MTAVAFSRFRRNPAEYIDQAIDAEEPVIITRADGRDVVLLSKAEYDSLMETLYLQSSPENARRLRDSIARLERGEGVERDLLP